MNITNLIKNNDPQQFRKILEKAFEGAVLASESASEDQAEKSASRIEHLAQQAKPLLGKQNVVRLAYDAVCKATNFTWNYKEFATCYLVFKSRHLRKHEDTDKNPTAISAKFVNESGGGKSYLVDRVIDLSPESGFLEFDLVSSKGIFSIEDGDTPIDHKVLIASEINAITDPVVLDCIRLLISKGRLRYRVNQPNEKGRYVGGWKVVDASISFVTTTVLPKAGHETETRLLSVPIYNPPEQVRAVLDSMGRGEERGHIGLPEEETMEYLSKPFKAHDELIAEHGFDVRIPFATAITDLIDEKTSPRIFRDIHSVFSLIKSHALTHFDSREIVNNQVQCTFEDYAFIEPLVNHVVSEALEQSVPPPHRKVLDAIKAVIEFQKNDGMQSDNTPLGASRSDLIQDTGIPEPL